MLTISDVYWMPFKISYLELGIHVITQVHIKNIWWPKGQTIKNSLNDPFSRNHPPLKVRGLAFQFSKMSSRVFISMLFGSLKSKNPAKTSQNLLSTPLEKNQITMFTKSRIRWLLLYFLDPWSRKTTKYKFVPYSTS